MDPKPATFDVTYTFNFTAMEPSIVRRAPRPVPRADTVVLHVPVVTAEQAPVVLRIPDSLFTPDALRTASLRGYAGRLYAPQADAFTDSHPWQVTITAGSDEFPSRIIEPRHFVDSRTRDERIAALHEQYGHHLVIDGGVWTLTDEPVYEVVTKGDGPGSTTLIVRAGGGDPSRIHPATDHTAAVVHAIEVAADRDDGWSIPELAGAAAIEVLDETYVKTPSRVDAQASNEIAMLALIDQAKSILHATDGRDWWRRINRAMTTLAQARAIAYEQLR